MISLLTQNAQGAIIELDQHELLLVMALVHEGRISLGCNNEFGTSVDHFSVSVNNLVEEARRKLVEIERPISTTSGIAT